MVEIGQVHRPQLRLAAAEHLRDGAVQAQPPALEVDERHPDRRVVERAAEQLLGGAQGVLDAAALGDVLARALDDRRAALLVADDLAAGVDHPQLAVGADDAVVEAPRPALGDGVLDHAGDARAVVGVDAVEVRAVRAREASGRTP